MEFPGGFECREHWEEVHFYPYLKDGTFDSGSALRKDMDYMEKPGDNSTP